MSNLPNQIKKLKHKNGSSSGFTLIELMVSVAIMATLFTASYAGYRNFSRRKTLESEGQKIKTILRLAQQNALSGKMSKECNVSPFTGYVGYEFALVNNGGTYNGYILRGRCQNNPISDPDYASPGYTLPSGYTIALNSGTYITFKALGKGVDSARTVTLTHTSSGDSYSFNINVNGSIN